MQSNFLKLFFGLLFLNICWAERPCVPENRSIALTPVTMDDKCCPGLVLKKPQEGELGTIGTCIKKSCLSAGQSIGIYPGALKCCEGLEVQPPEPGIMGSGGTCVNYRIPSPQNVNDSRINMKEGGLKLDPDSQVKPTQVNPE